MLAVQFTFPAGRYHATPWERHVNEGAVAWPPEPWRILRALIATWHHKLAHMGSHEEQTLEHLIDSLSHEPPCYHLPTAIHSHTRHYMPLWKSETPTLVFDAFVAVPRDEPLFVIWENLELCDKEQALLADLLPLMGYLGRAESWVEAQIVNDMKGLPEVNCRLADSDARAGSAAVTEIIEAGHPASSSGIVESSVVDNASGELIGERVTLYAPLPDDAYQLLRAEWLDWFKDKKATTKKNRKNLPDTLLNALSVDNADLRKCGWSRPPAARTLGYLRPMDALRPQPTTQSGIKPLTARCVSFMLIGKPLPRVEDTLRIGELARRAIMSRCKELYGEADIPWIFSGHDLPSGAIHRHAFYLPWDSDDDGHIDHLLVYVPEGMDKGQQAILANELNALYNRNRDRKYRMVMEAMGDTDVIASALTRANTTWQSVTPYLHPWHAKKGFDIKEQLKRECCVRNLPALIDIEKLDQIDVGKDRRCHPIRFKRFRQHQGLIQPDHTGSFWRLHFAKEVEGPLALGFSCHFGLGLFKPKPVA